MKAFAQADHRKGPGVVASLLAVFSFAAAATGLALMPQDGQSTEREAALASVQTVTEADMQAFLNNNTPNGHVEQARLVYGCKKAWIPTGKGTGYYSRPVCGYWNVP